MKAKRWIVFFCVMTDCLIFQWTSLFTCIPSIITVHSCLLFSTQPTGVPDGLPSPEWLLIVNWFLRFRHLAVATRICLGLVSRGKKEFWRESDDQAQTSGKSQPKISIMNANKIASSRHRHVTSRRRWLEQSTVTLRMAAAQVTKTSVKQTLFHPEEQQTSQQSSYCCVMNLQEYNHTH